MGECHLKMEAEIGVITSQGTSGLPETSRNWEVCVNKYSLWALKKNPILLTPLFQTSVLQNCGRINFCCFKPLNCGKLNTVHKDECPVMPCARRSCA